MHRLDPDLRRGSRPAILVSWRTLTIPMMRLVIALALASAAKRYPAIPFGFRLCQRQLSTHMASMSRWPCQPSSRCGRLVSA